MKLEKVFSGIKQFASTHRKNMQALWRARPFYASLFVFVLLCLVFSVFYLTANGVSSLDDHFFYFRYAELLRDNGLDMANNFPWVYFSEMARENTRYPVSLFQISLVPFTYFENEIAGLKLADVFFASLSLALLYYVMRKMKIRYAFLVVLFLVSTDAFFHRMIMGRPYVLIASLVFLEMYLAVHKRYKLLFLAALFHILWHQGTFFMPVLITVVVEISRNIRTGKIYVKNLAAAVFSTLLGALLYPNFLEGLWSHGKTIFSIHYTMMTASKMRYIEGADTLSKTLETVSHNSEIALLIFVSSLFLVVMFFRSQRKKAGGEAKNADLDIMVYSVFLFTLTVLGGSIMVSGRFYDFYFPGALLLGGLAWRKIRLEYQLIADPAIKKIFVPALTVFLLITFGYAMIGMMELSASHNYRPYKKLSDWVRNNSQPGDVVFLRNWSDFPLFFFYNTDSYYSMGMEPMALREYDPKLFWRWYNIYLGNFYCEKMGDCSLDEEITTAALKFDEERKNEFLNRNSQKIIESIKNDFHSKIVISDSSSFNEMLERNSEMIEANFQAESEKSKAVLKAYKLR